MIVGLLPNEAASVATTKLNKAANQLGLSVINLTIEQRKQMHLPQQGVLIERVSRGPALNAGIQQGDIILRIQNNVVRDVTDFDRIVSSLPLDQSIAVLIQRKGSPIFLALKINK